MTPSMMQRWMHHENEAALAALVAARLSPPSRLKAALHRRVTGFSNPNVGRFQSAVAAIDALELVAHSGELGPVITMGEGVDAPTQRGLKNGLMGLCPWRKGPFSCFGVTVDAEWQSHLKWDRLGDLDPLIRDKAVLDVGSNSGYYLYRMLAHSPRLALGIDTSDLMWVQHHVLQRWIQPWAGDAWMLGIGVDDLAGWRGVFDTVFAMGMLYHRPDPIAFLMAMRQLLKPSGTLVLETLVMPGEGHWSLMPYPRYAKMRNVHMIPTVDAMGVWLQKAGYRWWECGHMGVTTVTEQRRTEWIQTESLGDFLLDDDHTVEGYPRPHRAVMRAGWGTRPAGADVVS